jgi:hypothetical protein
MFCLTSPIRWLYQSRTRRATLMSCGSNELIDSFSNNCYNLDSDIQSN